MHDNYKMPFHLKCYWTVLVVFIHTKSISVLGKFTVSGLFASGFFLLRPYKEKQ